MSSDSDYSSDDEPRRRPELIEEDISNRASRTSPSFLHTPAWLQNIMFLYLLNIF